MKPVMYHGQRVGCRGQIYHQFKDKKGETYHFAGRIKGLAFGSIYKMLDGDKMSTRPEEVLPPPWEPSQSDRLEFETHKVTVNQAKASKRKDLELKKPHRDLIRAIELVRPFYQVLDDFERHRLMSWFSNQCSKKKGTK